MASAVAPTVPRSASSRRIRSLLKSMKQRLQGGRPGGWTAPSRRTYRQATATLPHGQKGSAMDWIIWLVVIVAIVAVVWWLLNRNSSRGSSGSAGRHRDRRRRRRSTPPHLHDADHGPSHRGALSGGGSAASAAAAGLAWMPTSAGSTRPNPEPNPNQRPTPRRGRGSGGRRGAREGPGGRSGRRGACTHGRRAGAPSAARVKPPAEAAPAESPNGKPSGPRRPPAEPHAAVHPEPVTRPAVRTPDGARAAAGAAAGARQHRQAPPCTTPNTRSPTPRPSPAPNRPRRRPSPTRRPARHGRRTAAGTATHRDGTAMPGRPTPQTAAESPLPRPRPGRPPCPRPRPKRPPATRPNPPATSPPTSPMARVGGTGGRRQRPRGLHRQGQCLLDDLPRRDQPRLRGNPRRGLVPVPAPTPRPPASGRRAGRGSSPVAGCRGTRRRIPGRR